MEVRSVKYVLSSFSLDQVYFVSDGGSFSVSYSDDLTFLFVCIQLHSCDLEDGYDWGRLNLRSVTEQSNLAEFLSTAELAGIEFKAEKLNIKIVGTDTYTGLPTKLERAEAREVEQENVQYLSIPRRFEGGEKGMYD